MTTISAASRTSLENSLNSSGMTSTNGASAAVTAEHQQIWRQDAQRSPRPELAEGESAALQARDDLRDDQEAGDDEEDVDADIAAGNPGNTDMVEHDGKDRHRAQAVDERPVGRDIRRNDRSD